MKLLNFDNDEQVKGFMFLVGFVLGIIMLLIGGIGHTIASATPIVIVLYITGGTIGLITFIMLCVGIFDDDFDFSWVYRNK